MLTNNFCRTHSELKGIRNNIGYGDIEILLNLCYRNKISEPGLTP